VTAQTTFATCLTILLIINGIMFFAGNADYGNIAGLNYVTFDLASVILSFGVLVGLMILASINVFGSGLDAGVLKYVFGFAVLIGIMFQVTFTYSTYTFDIGLGLLSNILYPYFNPASTNLFSDLGLIISSIFGMITLGSGILTIGSA
jgi:hypothetical protein